MALFSDEGKTKRDERIRHLAEQLSRLLIANPTEYAAVTPKAFPLRPGIYVISDKSGEVIRAGKTSIALQQRLYANHLMGSQSGNLPQ
jgi:hypothetical protein